MDFITCRPNARIVRLLLWDRKRLVREEDILVVVATRTLKYLWCNLNYSALLL